VRLLYFARRKLKRELRRIPSHQFRHMESRLKADVGPRRFREVKRLYEEIQIERKGQPA
jgi:hypothetical protein